MVLSSKPNNTKYSTVLLMYYQAVWRTSMLYSMSVLLFSVVYTGDPLEPFYTVMLYGCTEFSSERQAFYDLIICMCKNWGLVEILLPVSLHLIP